MSESLLILILPFLGLLLFLVPLWQIAGDVRRIKHAVEWWWQRANAEHPRHPNDPRPPAS